MPSFHSVLSTSAPLNGLLLAEGKATMNDKMSCLKVLLGRRTRVLRVDGSHKIPITLLGPGNGMKLKFRLSVCPVPYSK